ncbi:MAG: cytochrome c3 family protein [Proteobacteria bacterium]|nr:cytochrome c3 family protein [Pseudomonadota bacterium]
MLRPAISRSLVPMLVFLLSLLSLAVSQPAQAWWMYTPGDTVDNVGYQPKQPIPFSHKLHAGEKEIPCQYCHSSARRSTAAGIPPVNTCMGCHRLVDPEHNLIKQVAEHYKKNDPIQWVKVHDLPDFVRFSHKIHVNAGLDCQGCHGKVQDMDVVSQVAPLQMGWCIGCHKTKGAKIDCVACHY